MKRVFFLILYYGFATHLPDSYAPILGKIANFIRIACVKRIVKKCGNISTINKGAYFGNGRDIEMGDYSGMGANCHLPNNIIIGKYVMMGPDVYVVSNADSHEFSRTDIPMALQGKREFARTIIGDDCWIGARVMIMPGRKIGKGCVLAAGAVVTKNVEQYSVMGGNPAKKIKSRLTEEK